MEHSIKHTDKIGSILWLLIAAAVFVAAEDLPTGTGETGVGFYPQVIAVLIAVFAIGQLGRSIYENAVNEHTITGGQIKRVGTATALVMAYVFLLPWLGFVTATASFLVVSMIYSGARSPARITGVAIGLSILLYYVFAVFLRISLPQNPFVPVEGLLPGMVGRVLLDAAFVLSQEVVVIAPTYGVIL
jgi:putative tricarboxylic transport membrane protein